MKNNIKYLLIFTLACFLICLSLLVFLTVKNKHAIYENWQTKRNLLVIPKNTDFDILIMGGTQGLNLSRGINHNNTEKILNKNMLNIARYGGKGGIKQEKAYLTYFYERNNKTKKILYFLTPWILYSPKYNENNLESFNNEPFNLHFFIVLLKTNINKIMILNYLKANFEGIHPKVKTFQGSDIKSYIYTPEDEKAFLANKYSSGTNEKIFKKHAEELISIIKIAKKHNSEISIVVSPTLIKKNHITDLFKSFLEELKTKYNTQYYDFSAAINDQSMYRDMDHLNSAGVKNFVQNYLQPELDKQSVKQENQ